MLKINIGVLVTGLSLLVSAPLYADKMHSNKESSRDRNAMFPSSIPVPVGFQPEGVITGRGHNAYVGSLKDGSIYKVNLRTGKGHLFVNGASGKSAVGLAYDNRAKNIFVAGGITGDIAVYDERDGSELKRYHVGSAGGFINDGIVTKDAAYFTDSFVPVMYRIPFTHKGDLPDESAVETISLSGDFVHVSGQFNANGIEASENGKHLFIINSITGVLFRVNPLSGIAQTVDLGGVLLQNGDGILKRGKSLYVVQNFDNQITEVRLSKNGLSGDIGQVITSAAFQIPTTISSFGHALYAINARFDISPPPLPGYPVADPNITYDLVRVAIDD